MSENNKRASVTIQEDAWEDASGIDPEEADPRSRALLGTRLWACLQINGVSHHVVAIEVNPKKIESGWYQTAVNPNFEDELQNYAVSSAGEGCFKTVAIKGRQYVLCTTPYCD